MKNSATNKLKLRRVVMSRMQLSEPRIDPRAAAFIAHLTATVATALTRPLTLARSGLVALGNATMSFIESIAFTAMHGHFPAREPEPLAPGMAIFNPRVVRFVLPRVFCHAPGLPLDVRLKVRAEPRGMNNGTDDGSVMTAGSQVLGRVGAEDCVIAFASSGDWLQVRYKEFEAAWMLTAYRGRKLLAPLKEVYPGIVIAVATEGSQKTDGVRDSPFPIPSEVLKKKTEESVSVERATAMMAKVAAGKC